jgi:hypothetical protein
MVVYPRSFSISWLTSKGYAESLMILEQDFLVAMSMDEENDIEETSMMLHASISFPAPVWLSMT